jgi:hypothetical protein
MSTKIRNYVEVLFSDIPRTKKSQELKEEILANVTERFNAYIAQGKTENQAYSLAVSEMGDIDEMLQSIAPDRELKPKIDAYRVKRAKNTAIAVSLYIIGMAFLILFGGLPTMLDMDILEDTGGIIGLIVLLVFSAIATAMLVYTYLAVPQDIEPYLRERQKDDYDLGRVSEQKRMLFKSVSSLLWLAITIIYLLVSFTTGAWHISWIIFLIGSFVQQSIRTFMMIDSDKE